MKKVLLIAVTILLFISGRAQNYETIKTLGTITQYRKAKDELDKQMGNAKFTSKPEAFVLKAFIYASLAMDDKIKGTSEATQLLTDADAAFRKYKQMDPSLSFMADPVYQNSLINLYSGFYAEGYNDYSNKKWEPGYDKFIKAVEYSDLLIEKKLLTTSLDTNVLILAGITAENSGHKEDAVKFYGRMADSKVTGSGFESVYRFLVSYYFEQKNYTAFEKYKAYGHELYPASDYFTFDKIDFAAGLETDFRKKVQALDEALKNDPDNYKANEVLGEIIFDTLNPNKTTSSQIPDAAELENKMVTAFDKAGTLKPDSEIPYLYLGDYFISKAVKIDEEKVAFAAEMKARAKPGTSPAKEDIAKQDLLDKRYGEQLEKARVPYEKAAAIFAKKTTLRLQDKQQYKKALSYLVDIAAFKKAIAIKTKSPDAAKYAAEEKKWNDLYDSLK